MFVTIVTKSWLTLSLNFVCPKSWLKATCRTSYGKPTKLKAQMASNVKDLTKQF
jgi:hypothetical protein